MARQLTRDEKTKVLIYKGPRTAYNEDVLFIAEKKGYRLIDSRGLKKSFINKMKEIESISDEKMMFVEGKDVKLFTPKAKEKKLISRGREERAIESNETVAKAVAAMSAIAEKIGASSGNNEEFQELKKANEVLQKEIAELKKAK